MAFKMKKENNRVHFAVFNTALLKVCQSQSCILHWRQSL